MPMVKVSDVHNEPYQKPNSYSIFVSDLLAAREKGDTESKVLLEDLVPHIVKLLKLDHPDHCLNTMKESVKLILTNHFAHRKCTVAALHNLSVQVLLTIGNVWGSFWEAISPLFAAGLKHFFWHLEGF